MHVRVVDYEFFGTISTGLSTLLDASQKVVSRLLVMVGADSEIVRPSSRRAIFMVTAPSRWPTSVDSF